VSKDQPAVFVIAPEDVPVHVRKTDVPVMRFATSDDFERWRTGSSARVEAAVDATLADLEINLDTCSPRTQEVIASLKARPAIPSVKELLAACSSRRSFYRSWTEDIHETPAAFLERVRLQHLRAAQRAAQHGTPDESRRVR
jgi:transcriptional regulator GlxA family with amidase domain